MKEKQVAVLIDGDNISPRYAEYIRKEASMLGTIKIFRLYGSISAPTVRAWYRVMPKYGINPMLQLNYIKGKSVVDQALTIDAMDILYTEAVDTICIVTSDCDFAKLAYRLKEAGKFVVGMGEQKTNEALAKACDEFKMLDVIYSVEEKEELDGIDISGEVAIEEEDVLEESEDVMEEIRTIEIPTEQAIIESIEGILDDDWENLASVGIRLKQQISGFDARNYGHKNMTQFIKSHQEEFDLKFETAKDGVHTIVYIRRKLKESR